MRTRARSPRVRRGFRARWWRLPAGGSIAAALRRSWPSLSAIAVVAVLVTWLAWHAGGYFPAAYTGAAWVAFVALGIIALVHVPRYRLSMPALVALVALSGLAAWTGVSSAWSATPDQALLDMQRAMLYVAVFALGLLAAGSGRYARHLVWAALAVILVIAGAGLLSRLQPDLVAGSGEVADLSQYRLSYPLGYWNVFGALAAIGGVLAFGLAADPRSAVVLRAAAAGASVVLAVAMYLSLSRGAWLATIAGLVVLVALSAHRGSLLVTAGVVGTAVALAILRLRAYPALFDDPGLGSGQTAQGEQYSGQLVVLVLAVVASQGVIAAGRASENLMRALTRVFRPILIGLAVLAVLAVAAGYIARTTQAEGVTAGALVDAEDWVSRQWSDFLAPTAFSASGTARLTSAKGTRSDIYRAAFDGFEAHPLRGDGSGSFEVRWTRTREVDESVRDAHSLEFETLSELGAVGGVLLLAFIGSVVVAAVRSRVRTGGLARSQSAAVAGGVAVWLVHSFVDWDWQVPALTAIALFLAAALFPEGRRRRVRVQPGELSSTSRRLRATGS